MMDNQKIAQELVAVARELTASKATKYWDHQFDLLDTAIPRYDAEVTRDWNKVYKHYKATGWSSTPASRIAHWFHEYHAGNVSRDEAIRGLAKEMAKYEKMMSREGSTVARELTAVTERSQIDVSPRYMVVVIYIDDVDVSHTDYLALLRDAEKRVRVVSAKVESALLDAGIEFRRKGIDVDEDARMVQASFIWLRRLTSSQQRRIQKIVESYEKML